MKKDSTTKDSKKNLESLKKSRQQAKRREANLKHGLEKGKRWMDVPPLIAHVYDD